MSEHTYSGFRSVDAHYDFLTFVCSRGAKDLFGRADLDDDGCSIVLESDGQTLGRWWAMSAESNVVVLAIDHRGVRSGSFASELLEGMTLDELWDHRSSDAREAAVQFIEEILRF